ncbi:MAG: hypothetical protein AVDCRST_MAG93-1053 [uncultured Chloroflexia bacterium]|uniref:Uncharacterized protein n=1 Tax=uncultured Chloroflexia bacterium TaxID=1672391 RepID=A0A6J4HWI0_9CHLR|nr:MAG: hypothetical protein AVDCRST_MAG93-1053 [uncultured Chloroflexia bacterium]
MLRPTLNALFRTLSALPRQFRVAQLWGGVGEEPVTLDFLPDPGVLYTDEATAIGVVTMTNAVNMRHAAASKTGPPGVPPSVASPLREYLHPPLP